ncbi:FIST N-terminal domain-containing protein [Xinfangfangia sp. CPCC 101601]|uniref:FIST N-terminal domain-containing protein n=1 Tax=Pseudogemmobacter lacusdianii TaxID=3069608 RepID=A0ABU0VV16_9RHOB|nr:FIST N-terminal domain-containing protein [Xinfangfangia sp. CPCC 101601]MDQ2065589.1 FIST N-terminal domain-containing protein [Xinfangfangia sp. CPCC 101601]
MPRASVSARAKDAMALLQRGLGPGPFAAVVLFAAPEADLEALAAGAALFSAPVLGCTTAGEITAEGYAEDTILAIGLPQAMFATEILPVPDLSALDPQALIGGLIRARSKLAQARPEWETEFAFLMVDGTSTREDALTAALAPGLGPVPLFGGSAGDGTRFGQAKLLWDGQVHDHAAVVLMARSACRVKVFSLDHLVPTARRMVVTGADPARRIVRSINAEPAAREYARLLGKDPEQLTAFTFAAHPLVVRVGGRPHVRAIQRMEPNGDLVFFSAIAEGLVLTLAEPQDIAAHLEGALREMGKSGAPDAILACDCILRRMEAQENQRFSAVSTILRAHGVVGFSTYGEQVNAMHVNQTMTGMAIWAPEVTT